MPKKIIDSPDSIPKIEKGVLPVRRRAVTPLGKRVRLMGVGDSMAFVNPLMADRARYIMHGLGWTTKQRLVDEDGVEKTRVWRKS